MNSPMLQPAYSVHALFPTDLETIKRVAATASKDSTCPSCRDAVAPTRRNRKTTALVRAGMTADGRLPQPRCGTSLHRAGGGSSANDVTGLDAPPFAAAEWPRRLIEKNAPFGLRMGGKTQKQMLATVRRYLRNVTQPLDCSYRTCAIVGSAGHLRRSGLGPAIDAHDAVFRVNAAPTAGYEADVGSRTTWRVHNSEKPWFMASLGASGMGDVPELNLVVCHNAWIGACQHQAFGGLYAERTALVNPRFYSQLWELVQRGRPRGHQHAPSTGLLAIALGLSACQNVSVFGFSRQSDPKRKCARHYWECPRWAEVEPCEASGDPTRAPSPPPACIRSRAEAATLLKAHIRIPSSLSDLDPRHAFHDWLGEAALRERWLRDGVVLDGPLHQAAEARTL